MAELLGLNGTQQGKNIVLKKDLTRFGRGMDNDVVLEDGSVSGSHCLLRKQDRGYVLVDLDSSNGTRVNEKEVREAIIAHRDMIEIGALMFRFLDDAPEPVATVAEPALHRALPKPASQKIELETVQSREEQPAALSRPPDGASLLPVSPLTRQSWGYTVVAVGCTLGLTIAVIVYIHLIMTP